MLEFVRGSDEQYEILKESLGDGCCHVYDCALPAAFGRERGRLGFEKDSVSYILYIDKGLRCPGGRGSLVNCFLRGGSLRFLDFSDLREFLRGMERFYEGGGGQ